MIDWAWPITSQWIGPDDDPVTNQLVVTGVLGGNAAVIRKQWQVEVEPILAMNGLTFPDDITSWAHWDARFRQSNHA